MWSCCGVLTRLWSLCGQMLRSWYRSFADPPASTIHALNFVDKYWPVGTVVLPDPPTSTIQSVTCIEVQITFWTNIGRLVPWFCHQPASTIHALKFIQRSKLCTKNIAVSIEIFARDRAKRPANDTNEPTRTSEESDRNIQNNPKHKAVGKHAPKKEKHSFLLKVNWY